MGHLLGAFSPFDARAHEPQGSHLLPAKITVPSQAAAPRLHTRLPSSSATVARLFTFPETAIHRPRWSGIAAANDVAASKAPNVQAATSNASKVKAVFAEAGLSQDAVDHIVKQYPTYLRWDVDDKLSQAIHDWQQELGAGFLSEVVRVLRLLLMKPAEEQSKEQYLASIGIKSVERLRKRSPGIFRQSLTSMQSKVAFLQQWGFTRAQTLSLIEKHSDVLQGSSGHIRELLRLVENLFDCADRETLCDVMLSCNRIGLCNQSLEALNRNFTYFCACVEVDHTQKKRAWKHGVFMITPAEIDARLNFVAEQLSATITEAKAVLCTVPGLTALLPETLGLHVTQLLGLGFSHDQVKSMCLRQPILLQYSYSSDVRVAKWAFLTRILRLSHDAIAAKPHLLTLSLLNRLGPRWEYLQQLRLHGGITSIGSLGSIMIMNDTKFRATYARPQLLVYDEHFQKEWQQRWDFLIVDQQLSIQDIADNPELLRISLRQAKDT